MHLPYALNPLCLRSFERQSRTTALTVHPRSDLDSAKIAAQGMTGLSLDYLDSPPDNSITSGRDRILFLPIPTAESIPGSEEDDICTLSTLTHSIRDEGCQTTDGTPFSPGLGGWNPRGSTTHWTSQSGPLFLLPEDRPFGISSSRAGHSCPPLIQSYDCDLPSD